MVFAKRCCKGFLLRSSLWASRKHKNLVATPDTSIIPADRNLNPITQKRNEILLQENSSKVKLPASKEKKTPTRQKKISFTNCSRSAVGMQTPFTFAHCPRGISHSKSRSLLLLVAKQAKESRRKHHRFLAGKQPVFLKLSWKKCWLRLTRSRLAVSTSVFFEIVYRPMLICCSSGFCFQDFEWKPTKPQQNTPLWSLLLWLPSPSPHRTGTHSALTLLVLRR